ncbi:MAG: peptidoglycan DD-metalloendopeptidase family protein [Desulfobacterales bacterium]|nr:peptidoglycan DD-metalloendopeptidase family protein [Deltaproteobacteria bacterium]NNL41436.1 peptidoglycan DD-metalloendopeptidase family protein [Desulfobacterales bacterium]
MRKKNKKNTVIFSVNILLILFLFLLPFAFGFEEEEIDRLKKKADVVEKKIDKSQAEILKFSRKETTIVNSVDKIDVSLNKARRKISANKSELSILDKRISKNTNEYKKLTKKIESTEDYAAKRLVALYKMNQIGQLHLLITAGSMNELFQRKMALERILEYDEETRKAFLEDKVRLKKVLSRLNQQQLKKVALEASIKKQIGTMSQKRNTRKKLLKEIRSKKSYELAALYSYKKTAKDLDQTIESLSLKLQQDNQGKKSSFPAFKGLLKMPVKGTITRFFGTYKNNKLNVTNFCSGIDIKAKRGTPVAAVSDGKIIYSSWFKGYGNMIIIDHGSSYYTLYAHLEEVHVDKKAEIKTGDIIATVGDSGSLTGPNLHFEIRHYGKPVDPLEWLKAG